MPFGMRFGSAAGLELAAEGGGAALILTKLGDVDAGRYVMLVR